MTVDTHVEGRYDVVTVSGELDLATAPRLSEVVRGVLLPGRRHLVVDLDRVGFIDSTGLSVLIAARRRVVSEGGSMGLVCNAARCMRVLELTGLSRLFAFHTSVAAAIAVGSGEPVRAS
jgi:anti-sigma B factor antagonist